MWGGVQNISDNVQDKRTAVCFILIVLPFPRFVRGGFVSRTKYTLHFVLFLYILPLPRYFREGFQGWKEIGINIQGVSSCTAFENR